MIKKYKDIRNMKTRGRMKIFDLNTQKTELLILQSDMHSKSIMDEKNKDIYNVKINSMQKNLKVINSNLYTILSTIQQEKFIEIVETEQHLKQLDKSIELILNKNSDCPLPNQMIERLEMMLEDIPWETYIAEPDAFSIDDSIKSQLLNDNKFDHYKLMNKIVADKEVQTEIGWDYFEQEYKKLIVNIKLKVVYLKG